MEFVSNVRMAPAQVDDLGHLNHVFALQILEYARDDWYAAARLWEGRPWSGAENLATLVLNINFNYRQECFLDDALKTITRPVERGSKSFTLSQQVIKPDGGVAIDGTATSLVMDMEQHRSIQVPKCLARFLPARK
jgi:thioesterase-3